MVMTTSLFRLSRNAAFQRKIGVIPIRLHLLNNLSKEMVMLSLRPAQLFGKQEPREVWQPHAEVFTMLATELAVFLVLGPWTNTHFEVIKLDIDKAGVFKERWIQIHYHD